MTRVRLAVSLLTASLLFLAAAHAPHAATISLTDQVMGLAGTWMLDSSRGTGGICGVPVETSRTFELSTAGVTVRTDKTNGRVALDGSPGSLADGRTIFATTDAGWLKLTMTNNRVNGAANVMQEVYILNRDRTELTVWRTLNVRLPDGSSEKIDCGNRQAIVYKRSA